jgi:hypothetical protein
MGQGSRTGEHMRPSDKTLRRVAVIAPGPNGHEIAARAERNMKENAGILSKLAEGESRKCKCGEDSGKISVCPNCQRKKYGDFNHGGGRGDPGWLKANEEIRSLHLVKSGGYGTGDDPFANFSAVSKTSGQPRYYYPILRSLEKLSRCLSLHAQDRVEELDEEFKDVASLMLCATAMRREDRKV